MIRRLTIDNFKSLVSFMLPQEPHALGQFTCLIGLNGAGKSALLQAFDFLGQLMWGRVDDWLAAREWKASDLTSRLLKRRRIDFHVVFEFAGIGEVVWEGAFNPDLLRCTHERVSVDGVTVLRFEDGRVMLPVEGPLNLDLQFQGSVMSVIKFSANAPALHGLKQFVLNLKSLELLAPHLIRKRAKEANDVGAGGEKLSAYLHGYSPDQKRQFLTLLQNFYPQISDWETHALQAGWKNLRFHESYSERPQNPIQVDARHINDGLLRIVSILAQTQTDHSLLLFDEIENGINPELIEKLVLHLLEARQQIIVTTHSPMILNYLPDEVAREAVILLYRQGDGATKAVRYFDLPETMEKLDLLGPGEIFVDTDLSILAKQAQAMQEYPA